MNSSGTSGAEPVPMMPELTDDLVAELLALGTATIYEASGFECFLPAQIRPVWSGAQVVGFAFPLSMPAGDNLGLHVALEQAGPGDILVADAQGAVHGYWGEVLATSARQRGVLALIIDGGVRDTVRLREMAFPVFSSSICVRGTKKIDPGSVGTPIQLGGVTVHRGDLIVADADGIVVLASDRVEQVIQAARSRQEAEVGYLRRIAAGELTLDIYGFRERAQGTG
jgi:4-hydroxy-4-methyl-2-oxoglutarate aldolase